MIKLTNWQRATIVTIPILLISCVVTWGILLTIVPSTPANTRPPPTHVPANTPGPTGTPTSDIARSDAELEYTTSILTILRDLYGALDDRGVLVGMLRFDPSLVHDPAWVAHVTSTNEKICACYEKVRTLSCPSAEHDDYHRVFTSAMEKYAESATLINQAMQDFDISKLKVALETSEEGDRLLKQAIALLEEPTKLPQ